MKSALTKSFIFAIALLCSISIYAQNNGKKGVENNIQFGMGLSYCESLPGYGFKAAYGLDIYQNERWSIMPSVAARFNSNALMWFFAIGADLDSYLLWEAAAVVRYHTPSGFVFDIGPSFSYASGRGSYYIDANPLDPREGQEKIKSFDIGIKPSFSRVVSDHWAFGLEANIGLRNIKKMYPEYGVNSGNWHMISLVATANYIF